MIGWDGVYKVVVAMVPLYVTLMLGYASVKWWRIFTPEQSDAINRLVCVFILPIFTLELTMHIDPFHINHPFIGADVMSKLIIVVVLAFWAKCCSKGSYYWSITSFSLSTGTNLLSLGVPVMKAMYGTMGLHLVIQSTVVQTIIWHTVLLFASEFWRSEISVSSGKEDVGEGDKDLEGSTDVEVSSKRPFFWVLMKVVGLKMATNPNSYACIIGLAWGLVANKWHFKLPSIVEGCISIMSRTSAGTGMFNMGLFMAVQEKVIACGTGLTIFGMVLKFIVGPAAMAIGAIAVGLHGDVLRVAVIQAALPQAIVSFILAKEYGLHPEVISTGVIFGTIMSLPVMLAYYAILELVH